VLSDAVTGVRRSPRCFLASPRAGHTLPATRRTLRDTNNISGHLHFQELGHLGEEEDRPRAHADHGNLPAGEGFAQGAADRKRSAGEYPNGRGPCGPLMPLLLGENQQADEARSCCSRFGRARPPDRELYLNISQIYERSHRYQEAEEDWRAGRGASGRAARE